MTDQPTNHSPSLPAPPAADGRAVPNSLSDRVRSLRLPDQLSADRRHASRLPWVICAVLALTTAALAYRVAVQPPPVESRTEPAPAVPATTAAGTALSGEVVLESKGYITPTHQIQVSPKVGGMVEALFFEEGKCVHKGDILAKIETVDYQSDCDHARAALESAGQRLMELTRSWNDEIAQAQADLEEAESLRKQYYLEWKRNLSLRGNGALAARDFEQAESAYLSQDRRVERLKLAVKLMKEGPRVDKIAGARADVRQAEADLVKAEWRLDNCTVRAPVTGIILTKKAEEGNIVNPIAFNISASLCDMADLSDLEVDLTIQERDVARVFKGQRCRVRPEAFKDRLYEGTVSRLMPIADRAKGAVPVRVKIHKVLLPKEEAGRDLSLEQGKYLKPEMGAVVSFLKQ